MRPRRLAPTVVLLIGFAFAFAGSRGLWEPDEGRYTAVAAQMLRSGDWVFPALNQFRPHLTKPPMAYWAVAGGVALLGANPWGARAANAVAFTLTVLLMLSLGARLQPRHPRLPAVVFAGMLLPYLAATIPNCDTLLALFETAAMTCFVAWWRASGPRPVRWLVLMWAAYGLAFLTKGPPALLPLAASLLFVAVVVGARRVGDLFPPAGLAAFVVIGLGWYAIVVVTRPGMLAYFLRYEVLDRIVSAVHARNAAWYGGLTTYLPVLLAGTLPWSAALLPGIVRLPRLGRRSWWRDASRDRPAVVLTLLWVLVPLAVFLLARSRLPLYVLPLAPPLALLIADRVGERASARGPARLGLAAWFVLLVALRGVAAAIPSERDSRPLARALAATGAPLSHVVFVATRPRWGVALPVGAEVVEAGFAPAYPSADLSVESALARFGDGTVFVVPDAARERFLAAAQAARVPVEAHGRFGPWNLLFVRPGPGHGREVALS